MSLATHCIPWDEDCTICNPPPRQNPDDAHPTPDSQITQPNRKRLRALVAGDWTPYQKPRKTWMIYNTPDTPEGFVDSSLSLVEWDWDLLRHDIHVLLYEATVLKTPKAGGFDDILRKMDDFVRRNDNL